MRWLSLCINLFGLRNAQIGSITLCLSVSVSVLGVCLSVSVSVYVSGGDSHLVHTLRKLIILTKASRLYLSHLGS